MDVQAVETAGHLWDVVALRKHYLFSSDVYTLLHCTVNQIMTRSSCAWLQTAKTHAQRQRAYRERKKAREGDEWLRRERERTRKYYRPTGLTFSKVHWPVSKDGLWSSQANLWWRQQSEPDEEIKCVCLDKTEGNGVYVYKVDTTMTCTIWDRYR